MSNVASIDEKRAQREQDAKERALNTPRRENRIMRLLSDDTESQKLDLLKHLDNNHILKKIALSIEQTKYVAYPASTAFVIMLTTFSGYATRAYKVARHKNDRYGIPLGVYSIGEQPSGSAKDISVDMINNIFRTAFREFKKEAKEKCDEAAKALEESAIDSEKPDPLLKKAHKEALKLCNAIDAYTLYLSDTTPAGLEISLIETNGFFNLSSSEQSILSVLFGGLYSNGQSNNEIALKGFDGGEVDTKRGGRESYNGGRVGGSIAVFGQKGSIKKIFESSEFSGLQERFLKIVEPNRGGHRDFINGNQFNWHLVDDLKECLEPLLRCFFTQDSITKPKSLYELPILKLSNESYRELDFFRQDMEDTLKLGGVYHDTKVDMMGTLSKGDMHVLKIAACLQLLDESLDGGCYVEEIAGKHVTAAIGIVTDILMSYRDLMANEAMAGEKAQYEKIIDYLSKTNQPRTKTDIRNNLKGRKPFTMPSSSKVIGDVIDCMIEHDVLKIDANNRVIIA